MPTSPEPARSEPTADVRRPVMPTSIRVAAIAMGVLAALLLVNAGLTWSAYNTLVDGYVKGGIARPQAEQGATAQVLVHLLLGLVLAIAAWFLTRRQPWARFLGLAASSLFGLLTLFSILFAGGSTVSALLLFALSFAAVVSLLSRPSGAWLPGLRSRN